MCHPHQGPVEWFHAAMKIDDPAKPLDYAPRRRDPTWFRALVIFGCVLGGVIIFWILVGSIYNNFRYGS